MAKILFPTTTAPGAKPHESAGRLINGYAERLPEGAPSSHVIRRAPGLRNFTSTVPAQTGYRGAYHDGSTHVYAAFNGILRKFDSLGAETAVGALSGTDPVYFARNNKTPTADQVAVCAAGPFTFTTGAVAALVAPALPVPNSVCFLEGYFFFTIGDGRCFASGLNAITVNALDVIIAESKPDGLTRGIPFNGELYLFGPKTCEVWGSGGNPNPTGFPFNRTTVIWRGLASPTAVAGFEDGFQATLVWVADDNTVRRMAGYTPEKISPPDLDRLIAAVADKTTIRCAVYMVGGHPCIVVGAPSFTWAFDLTTQWWHERNSYLQPMWRLKGNTVNAFGKWLGGDSLSGAIVEVTDAVNRDIDQPSVWRAESIAMESFPSRIQVSRADFNFVNGTGIVDSPEPNEVDPQVGISWSDDGGSIWATPLLRHLGQSGHYNTQIRVNRCGVAGQKGRRWRLDVADAVYVGLLGGDMAVAERAP